MRELITVSNNVVVPSPYAITISEFKVLKSNELGAVYFFADHNSPYAVYDEDEREEKIGQDLKIKFTQKVRAGIDKYHALFKTEGRLYFDASTSTAFYPFGNLEIWNDIYNYNPDMKFIYMARNPIDRAISGYMHMYERGYTDYSIEEAMIKERQLIDLGRYYTQIIPFIRKFGRENVVIIDFDDLMKNRSAVLDELSAFLGVSREGFRVAQEQMDNKRLHANVSLGGHKKHHKYDHPRRHLRIVRKYAPSLYERITNNAHRAFTEKPTLGEPLQRVIINMLELEINALQELIGKDLSHWMQIKK